MKIFLNIFKVCVGENYFMFPLCILTQLLKTKNNGTFVLSSKELRNTQKFTIWLLLKIKFPYCNFQHKICRLPKVTKN